MLRLYQRVTGITTLGPYVRYGLWVQGCTRACPGCISPEAQDPDGGYDWPVEALAREILETEGIEGITVSGGEPFLQQEALVRLIRRIRQEKDLGVILYTGFTYPEIALTELAELADAIIDGPYLQEKNDGRSLRGSSNQRRILITDRYRDSLRIGAPERQVAMHLTREGSTVLVGVPSRSHVDYGQALRRHLEKGEEANE